MTRGRPRAVLVVDDEPLIRWALSEALRTAGYDVLEAGDTVGTVAAIGLSGDRIAAVLLDLRLPDCSDLTLLRTVRGMVKVPIILMTAHGSLELAHAALDAGAERVVFKPFDIERMVAAVENAGHAGLGEAD